jgi:hypothetical protein
MRIDSKSGIKGIAMAEKVSFCKKSRREFIAEWFRFKGSKRQSKLKFRKEFINKLFPVALSGRKTG